MKFVNKHMISFVALLIIFVHQKLDISLALLNGLNSYLEHFQQNDLSTTDENTSQIKLTNVSKSFEEIILCLAKSMRMQDEQIKVLLSNRTLLVCCSSSNLLLTNEKLWLKFSLSHLR